jgi:hypothetical protein
MKQGTVRVSEEFTKPDGTKKWYAHEKQYNQDTEDPMDVFAKAEAEMNAYVKTSSQVILDNSVPPGPPPVINVERTSEDRRIADLVKDIYACTQLDGNNGLWSYSKLASTSTLAQQAYDVMGKKLRAKESQELLDKSKVVHTKTNK